MRIVFIAVAVGLLAACGSSASRTDDESSEVSRSVESEGAAAVLPAVEVAAIPAGLRVGSIDDCETAGSRPMFGPGVTQWRRISYETGGPPPGGKPPSGFDLIVTRAPMPFERGETSSLTVAGQPAQLGSRYLGDGVTTPALVMPRWPDAVVEVRAHSSDMTGAELVAVAESLRTLTLDEWQARLKEHGVAWRDATADSQSTRVDLGDQQQGSTKWRASVLIPPDFKKSSADERRPCLQLNFEGVTVPENNCGDAWTIRLVRGTRFVFGITADGVEAVAIRSAAVPGTPIVVPFDQRVPTSAPTNGVRTYVAVAPAQQCYFTIDGSDRWSVQQIIRPLHNVQFEDACECPPGRINSITSATPAADT